MRVKSIPKKNTMKRPASDKLQIPKAAMKRLICEIARDMNVDANNETEDDEKSDSGSNDGNSDSSKRMRFKKEAYEALHNASETYITDVLNTATKLASFRGKIDITSKDLHLATQMQGTNDRLRNGNDDAKDAKDAKDEKDARKQRRQDRSR